MYRGRVVGYSEAEAITFALYSPIISSMGLHVGGHQERPDWPEMGPSLLIATCMIVAIRTAKWPARTDPLLCEQDMNVEIQNAMQIAYRVLANLTSKYESIFPQKKEPWYQPTKRICRSELSAGWAQFWAHSRKVRKKRMRLRGRKLMDLF